MNNSRGPWVALTKICEELELQTPVLSPGKLDDGNMICAVGKFVAHGTMLETINSCIDFCDGVQTGQTGIAGRLKTDCIVCGVSLRKDVTLSKNPIRIPCHDCNSENYVEYEFIPVMVKNTPF
jgi:hypothetical protein